MNIESADGKSAKVGSKEKAKQQADKVSAFIKDVLDGKVKGGNQEIEIPETANKLAEKALGHPIKSHRIKADEVRHINKNHGENGIKNTDDSIPLRKEDIALLPYIMGAPDRIVKGTPKADGTESVRYIKEISNGRVVVVEQEGKFDTNEMMTITMWADNKKSHSTYALDARTSRPLTSTSEPETTVKTETVTAIISPNDTAKIRKDFETAIEKEQNLQNLFQEQEKGSYKDHKIAEIEIKKSPFLLI